jgi:hypothetical protein
MQVRQNFASEEPHEEEPGKRVSDRATGAYARRNEAAQPLKKSVQERSFVAILITSATGGIHRSRRWRIGGTRRFT